MSLPTRKFPLTPERTAWGWRWWRLDLCRRLGGLNKNAPLQFDLSFQVSRNRLVFLSFYLEFASIRTDVEI